MTSRSVAMNAGVFTSNILVKKRYILLSIWVLLASLFPVMVSIIDVFGRRFAEPGGLFIFDWFDAFFIPLAALGWWALFVLLTCVHAWIILKILNLLCKPKEGIFPRFPNEKGKYNRDFRYWCMREVVKKPAVWAAHSFPLPWIDLLVFKFFGVKYKAETPLMDSWVSTEFLEIGNNVLVGSTSVISSSAIIGDKLIIQKVKIGDNSVVGGTSIVSPGTVIGKNVMLGARSSTHIGQRLEDGWIYFGNPATKLRENDLGDEVEKIDAAVKSGKLTKILGDEDEDSEK